jgi:hypothetical protein
MKQVIIPVVLGGPNSCQRVDGNRGKWDMQIGESLVLKGLFTGGFNRHVRNIHKIGINVNR